MVDLIAWRIRQLLAFLRYRPLLKCPFCRGAGGAIIKSGSGKRTCYFASATAPIVTY